MSKDRPAVIKLRVFISSVQKELAEERMQLRILLTSDPFLLRHTVPKLFEKEPAPLKRDSKAYLKLLELCQIQVLIIGETYGEKDGDFSATHREYLRAQELGLAILVCVKGDRTFRREKEEKEFFDLVKADGHTYSRFKTNAELHKAVRERLVAHIQKTYHLAPSEEENRMAAATVAMASAFDRQRLPERTSRDLDPKAVNALSAGLGPDDRKPPRGTAEKDQLLLDRGYLWFDSGALRPTAAGLMLMGKDPTSLFAHARIQLDVYPGDSDDEEAVLAETVRASVPAAIDAVVSIIKTNTRRTPRVVGLKRIQLPEYPEVALREALVNALAHRDYEDPTQHVIVEVFFDRIVVTNPGKPVGDPSLKRLESGKARSRSRNPLLSQGLVFLRLMEERGTGIRRMRKAMLDHGLDAPEVDLDEDRFVLTLTGPGEDLGRIKVPPEEAGGGIPASVAEELNKRQSVILTRLLEGEELNSQALQKAFSVTRETIARDMATLMGLGLARREGKGPATRYVYQPQ